MHITFRSTLQIKAIQDVQCAIGIKVAASGCVLDQLCGKTAARCKSNGLEMAALCYAVFIVAQQRINKIFADNLKKSANCSCGYHNGVFYIYCSTTPTMAAIRVVLQTILQCIRPAKLYPYYAKFLADLNGNEQDLPELEEFIKLPKIKSKPQDRANISLDNDGGDIVSNLDNQPSKAESSKPPKAENNKPPKAGKLARMIFNGLCAEFNKALPNIEVLVIGKLRDIIVQQSDKLLQILKPKIIIDQIGEQKDPPKHSVCKHNGTHIPVVGWRAVLLRDYISSINRIKGLQCVIQSNGLVCNANQKQYEMVKKQFTGTAEFLKNKYGDKEEILQTYLAYVMIANGLVSPMDVLEFMQLKFKVDKVSIELNKYL